MSESNYKSNINIKHNDLLHRLRETRSKETNLMLLTGLFNLLAILSGTLIILSFVELLANGNISFRSVLAVLLFTVLGTSFVVFVLPAIFRVFGIKNNPTLEAIALKVGDFYPDIKDKLCNVLQLIKKFDNKYDLRPDNTSRDLAYAAFENVSVITSSKDFTVVIEKKKFRRSLYYFLSVSLFSLALFFLFQSTLGASLYRIVNFTKSYIPPAPFSLSIEPKEKSILRGSKAEISVRAKGNAPERIKLMLKEEQQENFDEYTLSPDSTGFFKFEIPSLKKSIVYYAEAEWLSTSVKTGQGSIEVIDHPFVRSFYGNIQFPSYTKLSPRKIDEQNPDISALKGSRVNLNLLANKKMKSAEIIVEINKKQISLDSTTLIKKSDKQDSNIIISNVDTLRFPMKVDGNKAFGNFLIKNSGFYYIKIYDYDNEENVDPIKNSIVALSDDFPTISLIEPLVDVQVTEDAILPIRVAIADDYGFTNLKLYYRLVQSRYSAPMNEFKAIKVPLLSNDLASEIPYVWNLNDVNISPDDIYEYYLEVNDNDIIGGPKSARTQSLMVKLPSLDEVLNQVDQQQDQIDKELRETLKKSEAVKKDIQELNQELLKKKNPKDIDWKDKKKAEDIVKNQEELKKKMSDIQKSLEKMTQNLQEKNAISQETLEKYLELQKLLNEVNSPELKNMRENMQKAMSQVTPEQMQEAMKQVKFDEEKFRKSIERTMNILKRLKAEQKADALQKQAEELRDNQEQLEKQMDNANASDKQKAEELAKKQEKLKEDFQKMANDLKDLEKLMKDLEDMPMDELEKAKDAMQENETKSEMNNSEKAMKSGDFNKAKKSQKKAKSNMSNFAEKMKDLKDKMQEEGMKEAMKKMQKAISDMLELSKEQENVKGQTKSTDYNSTQFQQLLSEQAMVNQALANTINGLVDLSQKSFAVTPQMGKQLGDALNNMSNALNQLNERNTNQAAKSQEQAMSSMNQAVMNMQSMLSRMKSSGSCSNPGGSGAGESGESGSSLQPSNNGQNLMEKLQQMANEQQGINNALQQMGNQGSMSMEEQAQMTRMAAKQGQIQKSLEQLADEQKQVQQKDGKKLGLGNLDKIAEEMKETVSEMQQGRIDQKTLQRQERILSRLLDATRSINTRDNENRRESETGMNKNRLSPSQIDLNSQEGKSRALQELLKSIQQGYTKDYEALIRRYFEALQKEKTNNQN